VNASNWAGVNLELQTARLTAGALGQLAALD
jgi:hypothetical protein